MRVTLIACTQVSTDLLEETGFVVADPTYDDASVLSEFAGRACYASFNKPNPETATNTGYLRNIIEQRHFSVLEHGTASFYVEEVSRSLTHELVRHRHFSFSQLSQRFVKIDEDTHPVIPPLYIEDDESISILLDAWERATRDYDRLVATWMPRLLQADYDAHRARKQAREAARAVLPNMTPTSLVVTANHRSWREFLAKRATVHADAEICSFAMTVYDILSEVEPNLYQDFRSSTVDGRPVLLEMTS